MVPTRIADIGSAEGAILTKQINPRNAPFLGAFRWANADLKLTIVLTEMRIILRSVHTSVPLNMGLTNIVCALTQKYRPTSLIT